MSNFNFMNTIANPFVKLLVRSPLHTLVDKSVVLITYTGRKTGETHFVPVNYVRDGKKLKVISRRNRNWWRNMRGGAAVRVTLDGKEHSGWVELFEQSREVAEGLRGMCKTHPLLARLINVKLDENKVPCEKDLLQAAKNLVALEIKLS